MLTVVAVLVKHCCTVSHTVHVLFGYFSLYNYFSIKKYTSVQNMTVNEGNMFGKICKNVQTMMHVHVPFTACSLMEKIDFILCKAYPMNINAE